MLESLRLLRNALLRGFALGFITKMSLMKEMTTALTAKGNVVVLPAGTAAAVFARAAVINELGCDAFVACNWVQARLVQN
jgi:hypothetical protein